MALVAQPSANYVICGQQAGSIQEAFEIARSIVNKKDRALAYEEIRSIVLDIRDHLDDNIGELWDIVSADDAWKTLYSSRREFESRWDAVVVISKTRNRPQEAIRALSQYWNPDIFRPMLPKNMSDNLGRELVALARSNISIELAAIRISNAIIHRIAFGGRGVRKGWHMTVSDVQRASRDTSTTLEAMTLYNIDGVIGSNNLPKHCPDRIRSTEMDTGTDSDGEPLIKRQAERRSRSTALQVFTDPGSGNDAFSHVPPESSVRVPEYGSTISIPVASTEDSPAKTPVTPFHPENDFDIAMSPGVMTPGAGLSSAIRDEQYSSDEDLYVSTRPKQSQTVLAAAEDPNQPATIDDDIYYESSDQDVGTTGEKIVRLRPSVKDQCRCDSTVSMSWRKAVQQKKADKLSKNLEYLGSLLQYNAAVPGAVCFYHTHRVGSRLGLIIKRLARKELLQKLQVIWDHRDRMGILKTQHQTSQWFRRANRPPRVADGLGPYKYLVVNDAAAATSSWSFDSAAVLKCVLGNDWKDGWDTWYRDGSLTASGLFSWWFDEDLVENIIFPEFDMYLHHLRKINGKSNLGWQRNQVHSLAQQLMRQDPVYYALYVALRPDKAWKLISYPYYCKYAQPGDQTFFRHIDLNIPDLIDRGRGASMIQGTISLDDEDSDNCTEILLGFQRCLKDWWNLCVIDRDPENKKDGYVHRIEDGMYTAEDQAEFGIPWTKQICRAGDVRISLPHLPHGSTGPTTRVRRTLLPWFVAIQEDNDLLEVLEGGSWQMLSDTHRDMIAPAATPSGLPNMYGAIPWRFPGAVELAGLGALSDALVGRRRWNSPAVLQERDILLSGDPDAFWQFVSQWRQQAVVAMRDAWEIVRAAESTAYGPKSYFDGTGDIPEDNVDPDPDSDAVRNHPSVFLDSRVDAALIAEEMPATD